MPTQNTEKWASKKHSVGLGTFLTGEEALKISTDIWQYVLKFKI